MSELLLQIILKMGKSLMCAHSPTADRRELKPYNLLCFKPHQTLYWLVIPCSPQMLIY